MNKESMTTLQRGHQRSLSPVHIHVTNATPLHVHLKKPVKPTPAYPKMKKNPRNVTCNKNNNNKVVKMKSTNRKGTPEEYDFGRSYDSSGSEGMPDVIELRKTGKPSKEKEDILEGYKRRLIESEMENQKLVQDMEEICVELEGGGKDVFMDSDLNRLSNSQHFLQTMAIKVDEFTSLLRQLKEDRISNIELEDFLVKKKLLERDLVTFDDVCMFLRRMLMKTMKERSKIREIMMQREEMASRLDNFGTQYEVLKKNLTEAECKLKEALSELDSHKKEQSQSKTVIETLRTTKAHLQRELSCREAECNKLSVKVNNLQGGLDHEKQLREKIDLDKENLKKATRLHKNKASQRAEDLEEMNKTMASKEVEIKDLNQQVTSLKLQLSQVATEKFSLAAELSEAQLKFITQPKVSEQNTRKFSSDDEENEDDKFDDDDDDKQIIRVKKNKKTTKDENDEVKHALLCKPESQTSHFKSETSMLKLKVQEFENLLNNYKEQVTLSRQEADNYRSQVDELRHELSKVNFEKDFQALKLPDEIPQVVKDNNNSNNILRGSKVLSDRIELLDKRIISLEDENKELAVLNGKREEALHQINLRLEEKISENSALQRQLDTILAEVRRMKDSEKDLIAASEKSNQIYILELEGQINQLKHDIDKLRREKDEIERRLHHKMFDLQDELKQCHSTNRALQNFIHFLKSSYNATFDQPSLHTFSSIPNLASTKR